MTRDAQKKSVDILIGRGLIANETISQEMRERLLNRLAAKRHTLDATSLLQLAREVLSEFEPALADTLFDTEISAWVSGITFVADKLPEPVVKQVSLVGGGSGQPPFVATDLLWGESNEPFLRLPMVERAAQILAEKRIVTREQFDQLTQEARSQSFTVARANSDATIEKMRNVLSDLVAKGPTLREFKERVSEELETSQIGPGHAETVYRGAIQSAYMDGHNELADNPIVQEVFPYQSFEPIHDSRVRHNHLLLGELGIDGTNLYRIDDEFWDHYSPPLFYNCRCGVNLHSIESAARKGVQEAKHWLATGRKPELISRLPFIPFPPEPGWGQRRKSLAA